MSWRDPDDTHEIVIKFGRPFDIHTDWGAFLAGVREITVPFADRESAEAARREITVSVRPVHDAGGEDYHPVVSGEVIRQAAEIGTSSLPCLHEHPWGYDDTGNHWCMDCGLWHDSPHSEDQDPAACAEDRQVSSLCRCPT